MGCVFLSLVRPGEPLAAAQQGPPSDAHAFVGGALVLGSGQIQQSTTILTANGIITDVYADDGRRLPPNFSVTDLSGAYVMPGIIDTHVHLATDPSGADNLEDVQRRLAAAVRGGVTTVRDMGGDARLLAYLARNATLGESVSPDIVYSAIVAGPEFMADPRVQASARGFEPGSAPWARSVTPSTNWSELALEAKGAGVRGVKLYAAITPTLMTHVASAARDAGLAVWAHGTVFPARPSDAVRSGVSVLSHAAYLIWEAVEQLPGYQERARGDFTTIPPNHPAILRLLDDMASRGTMLDPTLFVFADRNQAAHEWGRAVTRLAWEHGVSITTGTDAIGGNDGLPNIHRELELLAEAGLPPAAVLEAATINGARAIGDLANRGTVETGKIADLLVLNANPLDEISHTRNIRLVVRRGKLIDPS